VGRPSDGSHTGFFLEGVHDEIVEPERLVRHYGDGRLLAITLGEVEGRETKLTMTSPHASPTSAR